MYETRSEYTNGTYITRFLWAKCVYSANKDRMKKPREVKKKKTPQTSIMARIHFFPRAAPIVIAKCK